MYQSIGWSVRAEFIVSHVEPRLVGDINAQVLREQEAAFKTGKVIFDCVIMPCQTTLGQCYQVIKE